MQYEMNIEEVSTIGRKLNFTVASGEVKVELERAYRDLMRKVRMPGFRPGRVPRKMIEARYAPQVKHEVFGKLIEAAYREAVRDLPVAGRPEVVEQGDVSGDLDLTFTIAVDFRPEIEVKGHKGVAVDMPVAKVTKADIDRAISQRLASQSVQLASPAAPAGPAGWLVWGARRLAGLAASQPEQLAKLTQSSGRTDWLARSAAAC